MIYGNIVKSPSLLGRVSESTLTLEECYMEAMLAVAPSYDTMNLIYEAGILLEADGAGSKIVSAIKTIFSKIKQAIINFKNKLKEWWGKLLGNFKKNVKKVDEVIQKEKEKKAEEKQSNSDNEAKSGSTEYTGNVSSKPRIEAKPDIEYKEYDKMFQETEVNIVEFMSIGNLEKMLELHAQYYRIHNRSFNDAVDFYKKNIYGHNAYTTIGISYSSDTTRKTFMSITPKLYKNFTSEFKEKDVDEYSEIIRRYPDIVETVKLSYTEAEKLQKPDFDYMISKLKKSYTELDRQTAEALKIITHYESEYKKILDESLQVVEKFERKNKAKLDALDNKHRKDYDDNDRDLIHNRYEVDRKYKISEEGFKYVSDLLVVYSKTFNLYSSYSLTVIHTMQKIAGLAMYEYIKVKRSL